MRADKGFHPKKYFEMMCSRFEQFLNVHERWPSCYAKDEDEKKLGDWSHKLRVLYHRGKLSEDKLLALQKIKFSFTPNDDKWNRQFEKLQKFLLKGELPPYPSPSRSFAYHQYVCFESLKSWQQEKLNAVGFLKFYEAHRESNEDIWYRNFFLTSNFYEVYGKLPSRKTNRGLEGWLSKQRQLMKKGLMEKEKRMMFEEAGIDLLEKTFSKKIVPWDQRFAELKEFVCLHGKIPTNLKEHKELYQWQKTQKRNYRLGKLTRHQIARLKSIDMNFLIDKNISSMQHKTKAGLVPRI